MNPAQDPQAQPLPVEPAQAYEALVQFLYQAPVGLVQCDIDGKVDMMNPMSAQLLMPLSPDGNLDNLFTVLGNVAPQLRRLTADFEPPSGTVCESLRVACDPGSGAAAAAVRVLSLSLMKLDSARLMAMVSDATLEVQREQQDLSRRLDAAARLDSLTQLPNRAVARERIAQAIARIAASPGCEFAVLFINCDRFRQVNDALGHAAGNELLSLMADRLRSALRRRPRGDLAPGRGELAARLGGDEFVILLDGLRSVDDAHTVAQRLVDALGQPYGLHGQQLRCAVSMGLVLSAQAGNDADVVLQDASIAMVEAKRAGGERYRVFEPVMRERAARRSGIERDLRQALANGQLFVVYQPVVGLQGAGDGIDKAAGVEALVRWLHPQRGVVPPLEFIGVAEECGLIGPLGEFVLDTACRQFVAWRAALGAGAPRSLAVNLSRSQLGQPDIVATVERVLRATGMEPAQLQLEVTESLAAQDETVRSRLLALKALGLTLALDDFGTGYSSLSSLHLLPVDTVKIDRSFVSEAVTSAHHRVLIEATVRVARSLRMGTVAEGIENAGQAEVVRSLGCEKGQGYLFSKPLPAEGLVHWLAADGEAQRAQADSAAARPAPCAH
jgi:diguanylate cyclase (GGDEF)-like protein